MEEVLSTPLGGALGRQERPAADGAWLISRTTDFWVGCAGGGVLLIMMAGALLWHGDREMDAADLLLSELHLGATYDAIVRRRLWRHMPFDVVTVPLAIIAGTYLLMLNGQAILLTTVAMYLAAWHRGRQNFGIARYYQERIGGALSPVHGRLFRAAIYLPMVAGVVYFTGVSPLYEGEEYMSLDLDPVVAQLLGILAAASVVTYLAFVLRHRAVVHPGERWLVTANALAFGSAYVLGAWSVAYILVLVVHHEIQYLYFTYAMARRSADARPSDRLGELRLLASFAVWPAIGLASWALCQLSESVWVVSFLVSGLLCHYWLDGRIWTRRARRLAAA
jgi:hypothetical protein